MSNAFLASLREKRESKTALIQSTLDRAAEEVRDLTEVELANVEALNLEIKKLDERIEQMSDIEIRNQKAAELAAKVDVNADTKKEVRAGGFSVTKEELTYSTRSENDFLTDALKIILVKNYNRNLVDVIIESYHDLANNNCFRDEYFWEVADILEWSVTCPSLFEKLLSIELNEYDVFYLERYDSECNRLCNEFERVLRHPTLSDYSQEFYKNEIVRLNKIRKFITKAIKRVSIIKKIKQKNAALIIQKAWYNHVERICHPDHPKMKERMLSFLTNLC